MVVVSNATSPVLCCCVVEHSVSTCMPTVNIATRRNDKAHCPSDSLDVVAIRVSRALWAGLVGWLASQVETGDRYCSGGDTRFNMFSWGAKRAKCLFVFSFLRSFCELKERLFSCLASNYRGSSGLTANVVNTACGFAGCGGGSGKDIIQNSFEQVPRNVVEGRRRRLKTKVWRRPHQTTVQEGISQGCEKLGF